MTTDTVREDATKYELMVIINPDLGMDDITKRLDETRKLLAGGKTFFEDVWGMRDLMYKIKKHDRGFYAVFDFTLDQGLIRELDTTLRLEPEVLRHMIVKLPFAYEPKSYASIEEEKEEVAKIVPKKAGPKAVEEPKVAPAEPVAKKEEAAPAEPIVKKEEAAAKEKPKKKETTLEDVDAKLKSIIENPDINF